jgi:hypothetical protein
MVSCCDVNLIPWRYAAKNIPAIMQFMRVIPCGLHKLENLTFSRCLRDSTCKITTNHILLGAMRSLIVLTGLINYIVSWDYFSWQVPRTHYKHCVFIEISLMQWEVSVMFPNTVCKNYNILFVMFVLHLMGFINNFKNIIWSPLVVLEIFGKLACKVWWSDQKSRKK